MTSWENKALGDICDLKGGGTPKRAEKRYYGDFLDWVTPSDLPPVGNVGVLGSVKEGLSKEGLAVGSAKRIDKGSVLFSSRASIGKIAVANRDYCTNQGFANFTPHFEVLDKWYLAYVLRNFLPDITALAGTTTYKEVSRSKLKTFKIPVPPIEEQHRIVGRIKECMERIDEIRDLRSMAITEAETVPQALIEDILKDCQGPEMQLGEVCGIESKLVDPKESRHRNLIHIGGANVNSRTGELLNLKTAAKEGLTSGKYLFTNADVLYSKIRPYLQKVARPGFNGLCSADIYPLRSKKGVLSRDFLFMLLLSRDFTNYINSVSNRAGIPKVNRRDLFAYKFQLPDYSKQVAMSEIFDSALSSALELHENLTESAVEESHIQNAVLHKAFSGEL